jgi:hypothetical protein
MASKYKINEKYFSVIDSEDKAYWLGFIYADGYLTKKGNTFGIELSKTDIEHLNKFNACIGSDRPVKIYNKQSTFGPQTNCRWVCANKIIYADLLKHGIMSTKSYNGTFPVVENEMYVKDVVRGIFDGDGCITYRRGVIGYLTGSVSICGTKETLEYIESFSGFKWDWSQRYPDRDVNNYQIACGDQDNITHFLRSIYDGASVCLDRKYQKYCEYVNSRDFVKNEHLTNQNYHNVRSDNTSGVPGVYWTKSNQKWQSTITIDGNKIHLGYFSDLDDAAAARLNAENKYLSKFWGQGGDGIAV